MKHTCEQKSKKKDIAVQDFKSKLYAMEWMTDHIADTARDILKPLNDRLK